MGWDNGYHNNDFKKVNINCKSYSLFKSAYSLNQVAAPIYYHQIFYCQQAHHIYFSATRGSSSAVM